MATTQTTPEPPSSPSVTAGGMKIGYARVSTSGQDLTVHHITLAA